MGKKPIEPNTLRAEAEIQLFHAPATESAVRPAEELLHELQVHQIELEMQNDELRRMQVALEESRDRYIDLYDYAPVGYLTLTHDGLIAKINLTATEQLGVDRELLLSRRFSTLVTPKDADKWYVFFSNVIKHNKRLNIELMLKSSNDTEFPALLDCVCANSTLRITLTDITEIKQAKTAVHEAETLALINAERMQTARVQEDALNRLQKIASQLPGMVFQFCMHVDGSSHCPYASAAIRDIYRLSPEEVREDASKLLSIIHPDDYDGVIAAIQKSAHNLSPFSYEYRVKFDDGTVRWLLGNSLPQREAEGSTLWSGFITDITERKRLEQVLLDRNSDLEDARTMAEKANLAKSEFLSNMSHELRTPLNAILGYAQLLEAGSPPLTDTQLVRLQHIIKAGWYLLDLINEILDLAVIESGNLSLSPEPVSLLDVMCECQSMVESQAEKHGIQMNFLPIDSTWFVNADRTRLKQALLNLLTNAIKYNCEHGMVKVECTGTSTHLRISINDNGEGLPPEKLSQLFQPFNRLGQETGTEQGTGIGLAVTRQLVELMGGAIGVESTVGVGSEFWIELIRVVMPPLAAIKSPAEGLAPPAQENNALYTLLYVDDNPANLVQIEQIIENHLHLRLLTTHDGYHGIALARIHRPDLILMDINMSGIDGINALKILHEDPATSHIPVIALTANTMPRNIEKVLEAGFFRYFTKPIKINEFINALNDVLKSSKTGSVDTHAAGQYDD
jgi:PAS domain S-box-containing protein